VFPLNDATYQELVDRGPFGFPEYPFWPLDAPGMPPPGPNMLAAAIAQGDGSAAGKGKQPAVFGPLLQLLYFRALYDPYFAVPAAVGQQRVPARMVLGHILGQPARGPQRADVMIIGKHPGREEEAAGRNFVGPTSQHFWQACREVGVPESQSAAWYATNLVRYQPPDPNAATLKSDWIADCLPTLAAELRLVRPRIIVCLGADASKAVSRLLCPNAGNAGLSVEAMRGRVEQALIPISTAHDQPPRYHVAQFITMVHPARVHREPEYADQLREGVKLLWMLAQGGVVSDVEHDVDHRVISDEQTLATLVDEILDSPDPEHRILALDAEWQGNRPWDRGSYVRTIQFSHKPKFAACVELRAPGGAPKFQPNIEAAERQLRRLVSAPGMRVGGHFLRADIPWIHRHHNIDLRDQYAPARSYEDVTRAGGWDTSLLENAVCETGLLGLEVLRAKYTTAPAYEALLTKWKRRYCAERGIEEDDLEGFGDWDGEDFYRYACYDADVTRRIAGRLFQTIVDDRFHHDCRQSYWVTHRASLSVLEMEQVGIIPDVDRVEELARVFTLVRSALTTEIRHLVNWPAFNPQSDAQCRGVLFGPQYARKPAPAGVPTTWVDPNDDRAATDKAVKRAKAAIKDGTLAYDPNQQHWVYAIPQQCRALNLTPITSTGKRPQEWAKLVERRQEANHNPSTGREVLGILAHSHPVARILRDIRFLSKALQTVLRQPEIDPTTGEHAVDDDGEKIFEKGLLSHVSSDGRIHTRILQTMETGRASSSKPNLQNQSSRREDDYRMILGFDDPKKGPMGRYRHLFEGRSLYPYPQRTIFKAPPGRVLLEADYTGAELAGIMWLAHDPVGIEDVRRNMLPDDHPDYFDIHSNSAVRAFNLDCQPTKKALTALGKPGLRVAAKNVNFGIPYGRGAIAIARQCREEGVEATPETAQALIDFYFSRYQRVGAFLAACQARVDNPGWIRGVMGRYRRFHHVDDRGVQMEQQRQACNFPIQNMVAEAVWTALGNMWEFRAANRWLDFNFVLQIHDAIMLDAAIEHVPFIYRDVFPRCMVDGVDIWPTDLNGNRLPVAKPYHLGVGREVMFRWGEDVDDMALARFGEKLTTYMDDPANDGLVIDRLRALAV